MLQVLIIGAGGWGREALAQMQSDEAYNKEWSVKGFLDSRSHMLDGFDCGVSILGEPLSYQPQSDEAFVCAIGNPKDRHFYTQPLVDKGALFISIRTRTILSPRVHLGKGCFFSPHLSISPDVYIGDFVNIQTQSIVSHDVYIGEYAQIGSMVFIGGNARIGKSAVIHPHSTILPNINIGDNAVIGAGSVVVKDVPTGATVFGNPARVIVAP